MCYKTLCLVITCDYTLKHTEEKSPSHKQRRWLAKFSRTEKIHVATFL